MADVEGLVTGHYGATGLEDRMLRALAEAGVDVGRLTANDLVPVDELHAGGLPATEHLLALLDLRTESRLLDVGSGLGGSARVAASSYSCRVSGVDLTRAYVRTATALTARVGLSDRVAFQVSSVEGLPFDDASFDAAMMIHVGMNLPDKAAVFAEVRRVLVPGGRFGVFDQMLGTGGAPTYPLPWALDEQSSFIETPARYAELLGATGFRVEHREDRSAATTRPPTGERPQLGPEVVFGPDFTERIHNNVAGTRSGALLPYAIVGRAV